MGKVTVYGASDDLIEVEGAIDEEFGASDEHGNFLTFSDGTVLSVNYVDPGVWRIARLFAGTSTYEKREATDPDGEDYTDRVTLDGDLRWVGLAHQIARADKGTDEKSG